VQVVLALISALLFALGTVLQQKAGLEALPSGSSSGLLVRMARQRLWLVGIASDAGGFVAQAAALRLGQLSVVQPLLVLSVVFALPLGSRLSDQHVGRREAMAATLVAAALAGFLALANASGGGREVPLGDWALTGMACAAACAPLSLLARRGPPARRAALLGAGAGILFALSAALTKSLVDEVHLGLAHVITSWQPYALAGVGYASMTFNQLALNTRALAATLASSTALDPVVSIALGVSLLHERLHASTTQTIGAFLVLAAALLGVVVLARAEVPDLITAT
jgi:drug/metabolite transporter (DMT)-like permease